MLKMLFIQAYELNSFGLTQWLPCHSLYKRVIQRIISQPLSLEETFMLYSWKKRASAGLWLRVCYENLILIFLNQNICCGYSKEPSQWDGSFEHPKHMIKLMGKKIFTTLCWKFMFILTCASEYDQKVPQLQKIDLQLAP